MRQQVLPILTAATLGIFYPSGAFAQPSLPAAEARHAETRGADNANKDAVHPGQIDDARKAFYVEKARADNANKDAHTQALIMKAAAQITTAIAGSGTAYKVFTLSNTVTPEDVANFYKKNAVPASEQTILNTTKILSSRSVRYTAGAMTVVGIGWLAVNSLMSIGHAEDVPRRLTICTGTDVCERLRRHAAEHDRQQLQQDEDNPAAKLLSGE